MLNRVYSVFDRRLRPLRNHVYLVFPEHNIAYARVAEPAFQALGGVLNHLAGNKHSLQSIRQDTHASERNEQLLFHGNVELLTARELKRRYPDTKVIAWVQDPAQRLSYCYERVILSQNALPSYYSESGFDQLMSPQEFVEHISSISDLEADNLFRSQSAALTHKGTLTADIVLQVEQFDHSLAAFLSESTVAMRNIPRSRYRISDFVSYGTLCSFEDEGIRRKLQRRYHTDYDLFYAEEAAYA